jgi:hypothetical protein
MSFVYFIENERGEVKIGHASDVARRAGHLRTANAHKLDIVGVIRGGVEMERQIHAMFSNSRFYREWFYKTDEMAEWIAKNAEPFDPAIHRKGLGRTVSKSIGVASAMLKELAAPSIVGDTVTKQIDRAHSFLPMFPLSRIRSIWYQDNRARIDNDELSVIKDALDGKRRSSANDADMRDMLMSALSRIDDLENKLRLLTRSMRLQMDEPNLDAYRAALRVARGESGAVDEDLGMNS